MFGEATPPVLDSAAMRVRGSDDRPRLQPADSAALPNPCAPSDGASAVVPTRGSRVPGAAASAVAIDDVPGAPAGLMAPCAGRAAGASTAPGGEA